VQTPTKYETVLNLKTAKALGDRASLLAFAKANCAVPAIDGPVLNRSLLTSI
jgi:hypothetical protein